MRALRYVLLVGAPLLAVALVLELGPRPTTAISALARPTASGGGQSFDLPLLVLQVAVVLLASRVLGRLARSLGQPQVVGEMAAGLVLGPSVLGAGAPVLFAHLFPATSLPFLNALSQLGLVGFMFVVGLEVDPTELKGRGDAALFASHGSIVWPFAMGTGLALALYPTLAPPGVPFAPFALFLGAAMSVTAVPVLARILVERAMLKTPLGLLALASAAVGDVTAWCVLAAVVAIARTSKEGALGAGLTLLLAMGFGAVMLLVVRPALARARLARTQVGHDALAFAAFVTLAAAWCTERLGVHALFGAFMAGVVMPRQGGTARAIASRLEDVMVVVFLPLFFAYTGLKTQLSLLDSASAWATSAVVVVVAVVGKFGGAALGARLAGVGAREACALGVLMNTRGLMELVFLSVGLEVGVLSPPLFAMMVVMALVTTAMTTPILVRIQPAPVGDGAAGQVRATS